MKQQSGPRETAEQHVNNIRRATRKRYSTEDKIRIVLSGLRGEHTIASFARHQVGISYAESAGVSPVAPLADSEEADRAVAIQCDRCRILNFNNAAVAAIVCFASSVSGVTAVADANYRVALIDICCDAARRRDAQKNFAGDIAVERSSLWPAADNKGDIAADASAAAV